MKLFKKMKDGGPASSVTGYWLIEAKKLFSIVLLKFDGKSREAYHTHAFNSISWLLSGELHETIFIGKPVKVYKPSLKPIYTLRKTFHKVDSIKTSWVISFRGPWVESWKEYSNNKQYKLKSGRKIDFS